MTQGFAQGPVASPPHWARIQLVQGSSTAGLWDLSSQMTEARVSVGSSPPANWVVSGPTVAAQHFEFYWDGTALWISPPQGGDVTVDGERVQSWRQLVGRCRLEFGGAAMLIETSAAIAVPGGGAQQPITQQPVDAPAAPAAPGVENIPMLDGDLLEPMDGDSTRMLEMPDAALAGAAAGVGYGQASGSISVGSGAVRATVPGDSAPPLEFEPGPATQIFDPEAAGIVLPPPSDPPPAMDRPPLAQSKLATDILPNRGGSRFAAPPPQDLGPKEKPKLVLPPKRTLALAGVALVLGLGVLISSYVGKQRRLAARQQARQDALAAEQQRAEQEVTALAEQAAADLAEQEQATAALIERTAAQTASIRQRAREAFLEAQTEEPPSEAEIHAAEQRAVHLEAAAVASRNEHEEARALYLYLASENPTVAEYPRIAEILRQKIACDGDC